MVRKSQEKLRKMTKIRKSQVKKGVFEKIKEVVFKKHFNFTKFLIFRRL